MALVAVIVLLAGLALAFAFTRLTSNDGSVSAATTAPAQPSETLGTQSVPVAPAPSTASPASTAVPGSTG
jgi:hypothetical protein